MSSVALAGTWGLVRPSTIDEACDALTDPAATAHAGGTDLMVGIKIGRHEPGLIVDLSLIDDLRGVQVKRDSIIIGAATPMSDLLGDLRITEAFPGLADAMGVVGSVQIRQRATLGGNVANASPAADTVPVLVALGTVAHIAGRDGTRSAPIVSLFAGPGKTTLRPTEIITALELPTSPHSTSAYVRLTRRRSVDLALVSAACVLPEDESPRVAFGAAGPVIERSAHVEEALASGWSKGAAVSEEILARAARAATESVRPIADVRAGERYRRAMAGVLLRRAVQLALTRASNDTVRPDDQFPVDGRGGTP